MAGVSSWPWLTGVTAGNGGPLAGSARAAVVGFSDGGEAEVVAGGEGGDGDLVDPSGGVVVEGVAGGEGYWHGLAVHHGGDLEATSDHPFEASAHFHMVAVGVGAGGEEQAHKGLVVL